MITFPRDIYIYPEPKKKQYDGILLDSLQVRKKVDNLPKQVGKVYTDDAWITSVYRARGKTVLPLPQPKVFKTDLQKIAESIARIVVTNVQDLSNDEIKQHIPKPEEPKPKPKGRGRGKAKAEG